MYDPTIGQFLSEDPIDFDGLDENLRRYVRNRPATYTDPSGLVGEPTIDDLLQPNIYAPPEWAADAFGVTPISIPHTWNLTGPSPPLPTNPNNVKNGSTSPHADVRTNLIGAPGEFRVGEPSIRYNCGGATLGGVRQGAEARTEVLIPVTFTDIPGDPGRLGSEVGTGSIELGVYTLIPGKGRNGPPYTTHSEFTTPVKSALGGWEHTPTPFKGDAPNTKESPFRWDGCPAMHGDATVNAFLRLIPDSTQAARQRFLIAARVRGKVVGYTRIDVTRTAGVKGGGSNYTVTVYPMTRTATPLRLF